MRFPSLRAACFSLALAFTLPAHAQDTAALANRLNRLEQDVNFLQRKVYQNGDASSSDDAAPASSPANAGTLLVRITQLEEQLRNLQGQIEEAQFATRKNTEELKKLSEDVDYRLQTIETNQAAAANQTSEAPEITAPEDDEAASYQPIETTPAATTGKDFPNANEQYNQAFKLLNAKKYSEAAQAFDAFVKAYPKDPLTSNAYYWLGESYYARGDYTRASEGFRKGFEAGPKAQKAPDNLLKLGMSLSKVKRTNEACIIFKQVATKYADSSARSAKIAGEESKAAGCK